jgi:hypothetical protein
VSQTSEKLPFNHLHLYWALALSVLVSGYLIAKNFNAEALQQITWSSQLMIGLVLAAITVLLRDGAYIYRIRLLTKGKMTWWQSTRTSFTLGIWHCCYPGHHRWHGSCAYGFSSPKN